MMTFLSEYISSEHYKDVCILEVHNIMYQLCGQKFQVDTMLKSEHSVTRIRVLKDGYEIIARIYFGDRLVNIYRYNLSYFTIKYGIPL